MYSEVCDWCGRGGPAARASAADTTKFYVPTGCPGHMTCGEFNWCRAAALKLLHEQIDREDAEKGAA